MQSKDDQHGSDEVVMARPGGVIARLAAQFVDILITTILLFLVTYIFRLIFFGTDKNIQSNQIGLADWGLFISWMILPVLYYCYCYARCGATPGKRLFGLRVQDRASGQNIGFAQTVVREVIGKWIIGLGLPSIILMMIRKDRRAIHDFLGRTVVIKNRSIEKLPHKR